MPYTNQMYRPTEKWLIWGKNRVVAFKGIEGSTIVLYEKIHSTIGCI